MTQKVWNVDVRLAPTFDALPDNVKAAAAKYGKNAKPRGILCEGIVHIIADEHSSEADVETTILHEIKGHVGIRRLYGKDVSNKLHGLYLAIGGQNGLTRIANQQGVAAGIETSEHGITIRRRILILLSGIKSGQVVNSLTRS